MIAPILILSLFIRLKKEAYHGRRISGPSLFNRNRKVLDSLNGDDK